MARGMSGARGGGDGGGLGRGGGGGCGGDGGGRGSSLRAPRAAAGGARRHVDAHATTARLHGWQCDGFEQRSARSITCESPSLCGSAAALVADARVAHLLARAVAAAAAAAAGERCASLYTSLQKPSHRS